MDLYNVVTAAAVAVFFGLAIYMRIRMKERRAAIEASRILYSSSIKNVQCAFCVDESPSFPGLPMSPNAYEDSVVHDVHSAIPYAWPEYADRIESRQWVVWFVRSPEQRVNLGGTLQIMWKDIPALRGIPERSPGMGYGGMRFENNIYVATYHEGRDPLNLYCHEIAHYATRDPENSDAVSKAENVLYEFIKNGVA